MINLYHTLKAYALVGITGTGRGNFIVHGFYLFSLSIM